MKLFIKLEVLTEGRECICPLDAYFTVIILGGERKLQGGWDTQRSSG